MRRKTAAVAVAAATLGPVGASLDRVRTTTGAHSVAEALARRDAMAAAARFDAALGTLSAAPAVLTPPVANVSVSWSGITNATALDWIGVYCADETDTLNWLDWFYATGKPADTVTVAATAGCPALAFRYFSPHVYGLYATSNAVAWGPAPFFVRTSFGDPPTTSAWVSWTVASPAAVAEQPVACLGTAPGACDVATSVAEGGWANYSADSMCHAPATTPGGLNFIATGWHAHARFDGLAPATRYFATVLGAGANASALVTTATAPGAGASFRAVIYGDQGVGAAPAAAGTVARVAARLDAGERFDFVAHVGDISYAVGHAAVWPVFHGVVAAVAERLPYVVSVGNHEYDHDAVDSPGCDPSGAPGSGYHPPWGNFGGDSGGEAAVPVVHRFRTPGRAGAAGINAGAFSPFWYATQVGPVTLISLSSEHDVSPGAPQRAWLDAALAAVDRAVTPWLVVTLHRPLVNTEDYASDYAVCLGLSALIEPALLAARVDVVIAGHYHSWLRSVPLAGGAPPAPGAHGIVHITAGAAGASLDDVPLVPGGAAITAFYEYDFGYSIVEANASALRVAYFRNSDDALRDEVVLTR